jgi:hypothetical protein
MKIEVNISEYFRWFFIFLELSVFEYGTLEMKAVNEKKMRKKRKR